MKVLVIGNGGREHALAWKLAQSPRMQMVYVAPGNGGTAVDVRLRNVPITDMEALADFAQHEKITLTVVGPEGPLAAGVVDLFRARGLRVFGPTRAAAQLESSKAFAKAFMKRHAIPTAAFETFTDAAAAHDHVDAMGAPIVTRTWPLRRSKLPRGMAIFNGLDLHSDPVTLPYLSSDVLHPTVAGSAAMAQALRDTEASVKASGGPKEQAWLAQLKRKLAVESGRVSTG